MVAKTIIALGLVALSSAQDPTVQLFMPDAVPDPAEASVVGADATATTYAFSCTAADSCEHTITAGGATYHASRAAADLTMSLDCSIGGSTTALCTASAIYDSADPVGAQSTIAFASPLPMAAVTVTAGAEKLPRNAPLVTNGPSAALLEGKKGGGGKGGKGGGGDEEDEEDEEDEATTTVSSTGGVPKATGMGIAGVAGSVGVVVAAVAGAVL
ncbi:hypothetical protein FQN53_006263 [Emmonsiellopsis sp. PD_33]|nr:hypothetical protein FQN53_006263 [Emmonsiellopsis sp. PD_33]